jgi:O-antigen ligase
MIARAATRLEPASQALALAVFVLAPIPLGSANNRWVALWCLLLGLSLAAADMSGLTRLHKRYMLLTLALLAAWAGVAALQQAPSSWTGIADPIWGEVGGLLPEPHSAARAAATAASPLPAAGMPILFALAFLRALLIARTPAGGERVMTVLAYAVLLLGVLSFVAYRLDPGSILGEPKTFYRNVFTGTFVNSNTAAAYFGLGMVLWTCRLVQRIPAGRPRRLSGWAGRLLQLTDRITPTIILSLVAVLACLGFVIMTASRAGLILSLAASSLVAVVLLRGRLLPRRRSTSLLVLGLALVVAFIVLNGEVVVRIQQFGLIDQYRLEVYRICLGLIARYPWLGIGPGAFEAVFPSVRTEELGLFGIWDRAHSVPLELAVEMGLPLAAAVSVAWIATLAILTRACFAGAQNRRGGGVDIVIAATGVALLGTLHSLVDFPLQTAGFLAPFAAVFGAGIGTYGALLPQSDFNFHALRVNAPESI